MKKFLSTLVIVGVVSTSLFGFEVDGLKSGMEISDFIPAKYPKNAAGTFDVTTGKTTLRTEMMRGNEITGEYFQYDGEMLGNETYVQAWFTKEKPRRLYAVRVIWEMKSWEDEPAKVRKYIKKVLETKYGKSKKNTKRGGTEFRGLWEVDENTVIEYDQKNQFFITYIDPIIHNAKKKASSTELEKNMKKNKL